MPVVTDFCKLLQRRRRLVEQDLQRLDGGDAVVVVFGQAGRADDVGDVVRFWDG